MLLLMVINKTRVKILGFLLKNPRLDYSIRAISLQIKVNYRLVYQEIMDLKKEELINIHKKGASNFCQVNLSGNYNLFSYIEELRQQEFQKKHLSIKVILHELNKLTSVYYIAILFGSYVAGKIKKDSDLDLLFIIPRGIKVDLFEKMITSYLKLLSYPLDINVISEESFLEMKRESGLNVVNELIGNHIILKGGEFYYQLLSK